MKSKKVVRKEFLLKRNLLQNEFMFKHKLYLLNKISVYLKAKEVSTMHTYLPLGSECDTWGIIKEAWRIGIKVVVPKTLPDRKLEHYELLPDAELVEGLHKTYYPKTGELYTGDLDIIFIPGAAFDLKNNRLGYGAGYYDTFLAQYPSALKVGLAFPCQISEEDLPCEPHDIKLDHVFY
ncbi:5-formyltetrahydrofolate cyclo-ligase [Flammeovirgaceae bacterium SG7u.111]|nr:5-formyltetrahydrofolate cyclo-ligase [Flammeovirgaceae bacterium SG7u.132]WPO36822.1 5-formyltetrahydrofolate cyclo-ligase [Flammeovirgaceae bacterium SG7u.111]